MKAVRLRKQERLLQKRLRELGDREELNIRELELDELISEAIPSASESAGPPAGQVASPSGLSQVSFGFLGRTSPVPTGSG